MNRLEPAVGILDLAQVLPVYTTQSGIADFDWVLEEIPVEC